MTAVHRSASLLALVFLVIHVSTMLIDPYAQRAADGRRWCRSRTSYRPFWLGLGTVAADLLVALIVTSLLRHRIGAARVADAALGRVRGVAGRRGARRRHRNGQHALWLWLVAGACVAFVAGCVIWRLSESFAPKPRRPRFATRQLEGVR